MSAKCLNSSMRIRIVGLSLVEGCRIHQVPAANSTGDLPRSCWVRSATICPSVHLFLRIVRPFPEQAPSEGHLAQLQAPDSTGAIISFPKTTHSLWLKRRPPSQARSQSRRKGRTTTPSSNPPVSPGAVAVPGLPRNILLPESTLTWVAPKSAAVTRVGLLAQFIHEGRT